MEITEEAALAHYGVRGMKWGVRKNGGRTDPRDNPHPNYTEGMRRNDRRSFGSGGVKRINRSMHEGRTRDEAHSKERSYQFKKSVVIIGASYAATMFLAGGGGSAMAHNIGTRAAANRGAATARNLFADSHGIGRLAVSKVSKAGVHKITTL